MSDNGKRTIKPPPGQHHPFEESSPGVVTFDPLDSFSVGVGREGFESSVLLFLKVAENTYQSDRVQCALTVDQAQNIAYGLLEQIDLISFRTNKSS